MKRPARTHTAFHPLALALALLLSLTLFVPGYGVLNRGGQGGGRPGPTPTPKRTPGGPRDTGPTPEPVRRYKCPPAGQLSHAPQRRRRPTQQQQGKANANTQAAQDEQRKKNITPLRSGDTAEGARITITSDEPLNDYSAYRSGDRFYVVIPEANAPAGASGLSGNGFDDVQVQKRGNDTVLSFKLRPGTNARVQQRFNRLDIELIAPAAKTAEATATPSAPAAASGGVAPMRSIAGRDFRCLEGVWVDTAYNSSGETINVRRGSQEFRNLAREDPSFNSISARLVGELIVMWKGKAYRIR